MRHIVAVALCATLAAGCAESTSKDFPEPMASETENMGQVRTGIVPTPPRKPLAPLRLDLSEV